MAREPHVDLSRRERQIMDILYGRGPASVAEVLAALPDPPSYSAVRAMLRILESKGHLRHIRQGAKYVYLPTRPRGPAGRSALQRVLQTFYDGSVSEALAALLSSADAELTPEELQRLARLVERARKEGR